VNVRIRGKEKTEDMHGGFSWRRSKGSLSKKAPACERSQIETVCVGRCAICRVRDSRAVEFEPRVPTLLPRNLPRLQRECQPQFLTFCTYQRWILPDGARTMVMSLARIMKGIK